MFPLNFEINVQNNGNLVFMYQRVSLCLKKYYRLCFETSKLSSIGIPQNSFVEYKNSSYRQDPIYVMKC